MLSIRNVTKVYPNLRKALDGVSMEIGCGVFGLLGPNGAGKTTLISILAGQLDFEAGSVLFDGQVDVRRHPMRWRRQLGFMPQTLDFPPHLTGLEFLEQAALLSGLSPRSLRPRMWNLLKWVNLTEAAKREAARYSRGMKQRLAVAAALLTDPPLLLLDEPTSGLDPQERIFFRELLAAAGSRRLVILSTHIVSDVERCCGEIGILAAGKVLYQGPPGKLVGEVRGRVWETPVPDGEIDAWVAARQVVSLREEAGQVLARVVRDEAPSGEAKPVEAHLEDAYMALAATTGATLEVAAAGESDP